MKLNSTPRYFYHSFPRPRESESIEQVIERGLKILECLVKVGVVLAPEIVEWNQPLSDGMVRKHHTIQKRICFTELSYEQLSEHSRDFGPFSIEWDIQNLRRLGAQPAFYIPQALNVAPGLSGMGNSLVIQLFDCQHTMKKLAGLKKASDKNPEKIILKNVKENGEIIQEFHMPPEPLKDILTYLGYRNAPFEMMSDVLNGVSQLFYPTDNLRNEELLGYYQQREWKLIGYMSMNGVLVTKEIEKDLPELICQTNPEFWNREISGGCHCFRRIDQALIYPKFDNKHILLSAIRIIVPYEALKMAKKIFSDNKLNVRVEPFIKANQIPLSKGL